MNQPFNFERLNPRLLFAFVGSIHDAGFPRNVKKWECIGQKGHTQK